jgi:hypothetical protein
VSTVALMTSSLCLKASDFAIFSHSSQNDACCCCCGRGGDGESKKLGKLLKEDSAMRHLTFGIQRGGSGSNIFEGRLPFSGCWERRGNDLWSIRGGLDGHGNEGGGRDRTKRELWHKQEACAERALHSSDVRAGNFPPSPAQASRCGKKKKKMVWSLFGSVVKCTLRRQRRGWVNSRCWLMIGPASLPPTREPAGTQQTSSSAADLHVSACFCRVSVHRALLPLLSTLARTPSMDRACPGELGPGWHGLQETSLPLIPA